MKLSFPFLFSILLLLAIAEVATTGFLYASLGLLNLISVYALTTSFGALILLSKLSWMNRLKQTYTAYSADKKLLHEMESVEDLDTDHLSPKYHDFMQIFTQLGLWVFAWIGILIPGLVTDILGYSLISIFLFRVKNVDTLLKS